MDSEDLDQTYRLIRTSIVVCVCLKYISCVTHDKYINHSIITNRKILANSADPDQTAPKGAA